MPATPFHLVVVLYDNVLSTSVTLAAEMWRTAEAAALGRDRGARRLRIDLVSPGGQPVVTSLGFRLAPGRAMEDIGRCDLVHIPAMWRNPRPVQIGRAHNRTPVLCLRDALPISLAAEMWRTAEAAALGRDRGARRLRIDLVSPGGQPVVTSLGFRLAPGRAMEDIGRCDLVHIPAMWRNPRPV